MNNDVDHLANLTLDRSSSSSGTYHSDTEAAAATTAGDDGGLDPDDEAIFSEFEATHLSGNGAAAAAVSKPAQQQQQQPEHAANGSSGSHVQPHHAYHRSKSSMFDSSNRPVPVSSSGSGRKGAGGPSVPGVAVARIEGCWLSHLNVDNKR
jgi:hypothetical protein